MTALTVAERDDLADLMASNVAPWITYAVHVEDSTLIADHLLDLDHQELLALVVVLAKRCPQPMIRPNDGDVDEVAVERACNGERVPLSRPERLAAARLLHSRGVPAKEAARRLNVRDRVATRLYARVRAELGEQLPPSTAERAEANRARLEAALEDEDDD